MPAPPKHSQNAEIENSVVLELPIRHGKGYSFVQDLKTLFEHSGVNGDSPVFVFEDDIPLGPSRTPIALVERDGKGGFCYMGQVLHFSASDNSDPNTNGRTYTVATANDLYYGERYLYSLAQVQQVMTNLKLTPDCFRGKHILEIGPGPDAGFALIMAGLGAKTIGIEKVWQGWKDNWHSPFIDEICRRAILDFPDFDQAPLRVCQKLNRFDPACIDFYQMAMEDFLAMEHGSFDIAVSVAVLEHVRDPRAVLQNLFAITKPGGSGFHIVDLRDHRDFAAPLEFLLLEDGEFEGLSQRWGPYWFGNRVRLGSWLKLWDASGFKNVHFLTNELIQESYYHDFVPRLQASSPRFKNMSDEDLRTLGVTFVVQHEDQNCIDV